MKDKLITELISALTNIDVWQPYEFKYFGTSTRCLSFFGDVTRDKTHLFMSQLMQLAEESREEPITVFLNTEGGSLTDGLAIYDAITDCPSPVVVVATGICASAGLIILSAGDYRVATKNTTFFYHEPIMQENLVNNLSDMNDLQKFYSYCKERMDTIIKDRSKMKKKKWKDFFEGKTSFYFSAQEALGFNLLDSIKESDKLDFDIEETKESSND